MIDPTPTPTAPDWRALCRELRDAYAESQSIQHGPWVGSDHGPSPLLARADAALATPPAAPDTTRVDALRTALRQVIEACGGLATAEVSDEFLCLAPGEVRAQLAKAQRATPPAATREAEPLPQAPPTEEDLEDLAEVFNGDPVPAVRRALELWGGAAVPVPVSDGWPEFSDCDDFERVHCFNPALGHWKLSKINPSIHTHWLPHWALPVPAAAAGEVQP
jgi:hypothetical protein